MKSLIAFIDGGGFIGVNAPRGVRYKGLAIESFSVRCNITKN